jgi:MFS family permease
MTIPTLPAARSPFSEPTRPVSGGWIALFATAWLGIWMAQLTPIQLLFPAQVETVKLSAADLAYFHSIVAVTADTQWIYSVLAFGIISGIAGACALIAYPLTGALSDRTAGRFGRRKPWILAGTLVFAIALVILSLQTTLVGIGIYWSLALIGFCMVSAAITATISDQVPVFQRGRVSGWVSAPQAIGTVLGLVLVIFLALSQVQGYIAIAVLLIVLVLPFLLRAPDAQLSKSMRPKLTFGHLLQSFWISPRKYPDFGWTLVGRILVNLGNALGTTLLLYFLQFGLGFTSQEAQDNLLVLTVVYLIFFILAALLFGWLSDKIGQRKIFVYTAAYLQGFAALLLAFVPDYSITMVGAALLGLGYGCFMAVDQALATQVLPDAHNRGKDLGIMNIATAVPQAVGPLVGALLVAALAGFQGLFVVSALAAGLGGLAMIPIKSVR